MGKKLITKKYSQVKVNETCRSKFSDPDLRVKIAFHN